MKNNYNYSIYIFFVLFAISSFHFKSFSQNYNHQKVTFESKSSNEATKSNHDNTGSNLNNIKELNLHKVDENGKFMGESQPIQNTNETPYKREEETKPVNNSKANNPK